MTVERWNIEEVTGYTPITTFYEDFSIADKFGIAAVKDTYKNAIESAKAMGYKEFTELVMALNWKIWRWYEENESLAKVYNTLWGKAEEEFFKYYEGNDEAESYYFRTTD